jgi:CRISPR type III-A-associated RAMP protein Csm4
MNPGLVVKLRPSGPWRIGPDSGARNRVDVIYHSDSLYSAVTAAMARLGWLEEWLDATARTVAPAVSFSSCFPYLDDIVFVVPPRTLWPPASPSTKAAKVRWKSARFVPLTVVQLILAGLRLDENQWSVDGPSDCLVPAGSPGPFRTAVRSNAGVDRLTGASERHSTACLEFRAGSGLWTVVSFADESAQESWSGKVKAAFRLLADTGFGGERSRGWGRSEAPEFTDGMLPDLILPVLINSAAAEPVEGAEAAVRAPGPVTPLIVEPVAPAVEAAPIPPSRDREGAVPDSANSEGEAPAAEPAVETAPAVAAPVIEAASIPQSRDREGAVPDSAKSAEGEAPAAEPATLAAETAPETPAVEAASIPPSRDREGAVHDSVPEAPSVKTTLKPETLAVEAVAAPEALAAETAVAPETVVVETAPVPATPAVESAAAPEAPIAAAAASPEAEAVETAPVPATPAVEAVAAPEMPPAETAPTPEAAVAAAAATPEAPVAVAAASPEAPAIETAPVPATPAAEPETSAPETVPEPPTVEAPAVETALVPEAPAVEAPAHPAATPTHPHWLLSLFTPAPADSVDWRRGNYTVLPRGGRVDSPAGSGELKKQIQMVAEGSVLYAETAPRGSAADVAPDGFAHPVFRAGFAVAIPLPEVR